MLITILICLLSCLSLSAATNNIPTCSYADTLAYYNAASAGDVLKWPIGTGYWTNRIHITTSKPVTFIGAGMTNGTVIYDDCNTTDRALISSLFWIEHTSATIPVRVSSIEIRRGQTNGAAGALWGVFRVDSKQRNMRFDHINFNNAIGRSFEWVDTGTNSMGGVVDHIIYNGSQQNLSGMFFRGTAPENGNKAWTLPIPFGSTNMMYIESCFVTNLSNRAITDGRTGIYYTYRYGTNWNASCENHENFGGSRGGRGQDVSHTYFNGSGETAVLDRTGTMYVHDNTVAGSTPGILRFLYVRASDIDSPWGEANGATVWDHTNGVLYASGTHTGSNLSTNMTDTNAFWGTNNYWIGYNIINLDTIASTNPSFPHIGETNSGLISISTSNTITCSAPGLVGSTIKWRTGDRYEIRKILHGLDQPGVGAGSLISNTTDANWGTPAAWPNQVNDPCYVWNNHGTSPGTNIASPGLYYFITTPEHYLYGVAPGYTELAYPHPLIAAFDALSGPGITDGGAANNPTIASIANQSIAQDSHTGTLTVTLGSGLTTVNNYTVTTASTLTSLVPNSGTNYVSGGSGANRTLVIYPVAGQYGVTIITLTVTDEVGAQGQTSFQLTVTQTGASPPTITTIANISTRIGTFGTPSTFTIGDPVDDPATLILTASSSNQNIQSDDFIVFGGSGASRNVTGRPGPIDGTATVTVTVQNAAGLTTNTTFTITGTGNSITVGPRNLKARGVVR